MSIRGLILTLAITGTFASTAGAQGGDYTRNQLQSLRVNNSTAGFTSSRVRAQTYRSAIPQYSFSNVSRNVFGSLGNTGMGSKPFSGVNSGPSVSPYLNLSSPFSSSATSYYSMVRPQMEQQRINEQIERRNIMLQRQLNSMTAVPPYELRGDSDVAPTGHAAVYMNYGNYFAPPTGSAGKMR